MDIPALISRYEEIVRGVETQSCNCGGTVRMGDVWRDSGCGWSPEYWNDIESRSEIESRIQSGFLNQEQLSRIASIDWRLKELLSANSVSISGASFWLNGLSQGIAE